MIFTGDLEAAVRGKDFLVLAVPSPFTRATAKKMSPYVAEGQILVDVAKGIEENSLKTLSMQIEEEIAAEVGGAFRTEPCGGSGTEASDNLCDRSEIKGNGRVSAKNVYQQGFSCIYQSGCAWY